MPDEFLYNQMHVKITYAQIRKAMKKEGVKLYHMNLTGSEAECVRKAVNQGIDAHLEACYIPSEGDKYEVGSRSIGGKPVMRALDCEISPKSLPVLIRRLTEPEFKKGDEAASLAESILTTLGFNELGVYVGTEELGV